MGAVKNNWNAMEVAEQAPDISTSSQIQIRYSSQSVDPSLPLPQITPLVKYVSISLSLPLFTFSGDSSSFSSSCFCVLVSLFLSFLFSKRKLFELFSFLHLILFYWHRWIHLLCNLICRELCKDLFKKWSNLDDSRFSVETVSGGITNLCEYFAYLFVEIGFFKLKEIKDLQ